MFSRIILIFLFFFGLITISACTSQLTQRSDVQQFIHGMVDKHHFNEASLENTFSQTHKNKKVLKLMSKPSEKKPWYFYQKLFISEKHLQNGLVFWKNNAKTLRQAEKQYGVPASIIVAIIGIETNYGDNQGNFQTMDALSTLAFYYPSRSTYFKTELEQFLLLSRDQSWDPISIQGSYAGALGYPQFMPSTYRKYAVSVAKNKKANLFKNPRDAIISVANYLHKKGWHLHQPIAVQAQVKGKTYESLGKKSPPQTLAALSKQGVYANKTYPGHMKAGFLSLEGRSDLEFWLIFHNFYVIMAYNNSSVYAMAVYQLSQQLAQNHYRG